MMMIPKVSQRTTEVYLSESLFFRYRLIAGCQLVKSV